MAHDSQGEAGAKIEVTPAMIEAGLSAFDRFWMAGGPDEAETDEFLADAFISMFQARVEEKRPVRLAYPVN